MSTEYSLEEGHPPSARARGTRLNPLVGQLDSVVEKDITGSICRGARF